METVHVNKKELIAILEKNRAIHITEFNEALVGYRKTVEEAYKNHAKRLKKTEDKALAKFLPWPTSIPNPISHEADYDLALGMLTMEVSDIVELDSTEYKNYVLDQWSWEAHKVINQTYSSYSKMG